MKCRFLFTIFILIGASAAGATAIEKEGIIFKDQGQWSLFVREPHSKKATYTLRLPNKLNKRYLKEQAYVRVQGQSEACEKKLCVHVSSIRPAARIK